jgi:glycosyltransferase involved in cell wall biosynthesis
MKILVISDAWFPQINGVVRTLQATMRELHKMGHDCRIVGPDAARWCSFPAPVYSDVTLEFFARSRLRKIISEYKPDAINIATEGPLGWAARRLCLKEKRPFTTSFHTRFPEYLATQAPRGLKCAVLTIAYAVLRHFHAPSSAVMVATPSIENALRKRSFNRLVRWSRGVDTNTFRPTGKMLDTYAGLPRPILLCVGRVTAEKNLPDFLALKTPGSKVVIGDGPEAAKLIAQYPDVRFLGLIEDGETLARHYAAADLFVFPSTTETFGMVLLEACAAGLRIASYPSPGPSDIFADPATRRFAVLDKDLQKAVDQALALPDNPEAPRRFAEGFSWKACTEQFCRHLRAETL